MRQSADNDPWSNRNELRMELRVVDAGGGEASTTKRKKSRT
jgi:hypothetical protein